MKIFMAFWLVPTVINYLILRYDYKQFLNKPFLNDKNVFDVEGMSVWLIFCFTPFLNIMQILTYIVIRIYRHIDKNYDSFLHFIFLIK